MLAVIFIVLRECIILSQVYFFNALKRDLQRIELHHQTTDILNILLILLYAVRIE